MGGYGIVWKRSERSDVEFGTASSSERIVAGMHDGRLEYHMTVRRSQDEVWVYMVLLGAL